MSVGVVIGRFQTPNLHEGHIAVLSAVAAENTRLVVLVGVSPAQLNAHDPLPFFCRQDAIHGIFPQATVLPLYDCPTDQEWSEQIDDVLTPFQSVPGPITIYGGRDSAIPHYVTKRYNIVELGLNATISGTEIRKAIDLGFSYEFRQGLVYAATQRHPTAYQAVDIAVLDCDCVLMGKKVGEELWRFPGGFVDPADPSLEFAAARELREEGGKNLEVEPLRYIGSRRINDWRYRASIDSVTSALFVTRKTWGFCTAGDDLASVAWVKLSTLRDTINPIHLPLLELLEAHVAPAPIRTADSV